MDMKKMIALGLIIMAAVPALAMQSGPTVKQSSARSNELVFYENVNFGGDSYEIDEARARVSTPWNIRSIGIHPGDSWQICAQSRFREPCIVLSRSVHDAAIVGIEGQVGSVRPASEVPAGERRN